MAVMMLPADGGSGLDGVLTATDTDPSPHRHKNPKLTHKHAKRERPRMSDSPLTTVLL